MSEITRIIVLIQIILTLIILVLSWLYALPLIFIRRFHTPTNILTCNVCFVSFLCSLHWILYHIFCGFYPNIVNQSTTSCTIVPYFQTMVNCLVIYALTMITINRYFFVIYPNKRLFKRHTWSFISSIVQWIIAVLLPLPYFTLSSKCVDINMIPLWIRLYKLFIMVVLPSFLIGFFNFLLLLKVSSSTQHLTAVTKRISTIHSNSKCLNTRDISLLKHMLFIHIVFVIGWAPATLLSVIGLYIEIPILLHLFLRLLPPLSLLIDIIDLFLYNHELRQYYKEEFFKYFISDLNK